MTISCDNLSDNGRQLERLVRGHESVDQDFAVLVVDVVVASAVDHQQLAAKTLGVVDR